MNKKYEKFFEVFGSIIVFIVFGLEPICKLIWIVIREILFVFKYYFEAMLAILLFLFMIRFRIVPFENLIDKYQITEMTKIFNNDPSLISEWSKAISYISFVIAFVFWGFSRLKKLLNSEKPTILSAKDAETGEEVLFIPYGAISISKKIGSRQAVTDFREAWKENNRKKF